MSPELITGLAAAYGMAIAWPCAFLEAQEIRRRQLGGDRRKLNHVWLNAVRAILIIPFLALLVFRMHGWEQAQAFALLLGITACYFAPVHRSLLNHYQLVLGANRRMRFDYLGPSVRGKEESWYDTLFWSLASHSITDASTGGREYRRYYVLWPGLPFLLACLFEFLLGLVLVAIYRFTL
jgi:hypothetical protein